MEQQPQTDNSPKYMIMGDKADLLDKINPSAIVEIIKHNLMGEEFINGRWVKIEALKHRALSEQGTAEIANIMLGVSSQNVSISKLTDQEVRNRAYNISKEVQKLLLNNWKIFGITSRDQLGFVHQIVFSNTFITLKQPEGEGIRKMLMGTIQESRVKDESAENRGGGFLNLFRRR